MGEDSERTATGEVLESSELTARLLRRADASPGVLDTTTLRQVLSRLAAWVERPATLFEELMSRYRADDDSAGADGPLVMEQSWTANIHAYLTNSNSFSSTINQFISGVASARPGATAGASPSSGFEKSVESRSGSMTIRKGRAAPSAFTSDAPLNAPSGGSSGRAPNPDARTTTPYGEAETHSPATTFRVSRSAARRARDAAPSDAPEVARSPASGPASSAEALPSNASEAARAEGEEDRPAKAAPEKTELTRVVRGAHPRANAPAVTPPGALPLARTQTTQPEIQRSPADDGAGVSPRVSKADAMRETRRPAQVEESPATAGASRERGPAYPARDFKQTGGAGEEKLRFRGDGPEIERVPRPDVTSHPASARAETPGESPRTTPPLVLQRTDSSQARRQPPEFVWRKGADVPSATEPTTSAAGGDPARAASRAAGHASAFPSPHSQNSQSNAGEAAGRKDVRGAEAEVTAERILRNISRKLMVERERRGY